MFECILYLFSFFTVKLIPLALLVHAAPIQPFSTTRSPLASASTPLSPPCRRRRRDAAAVDALVPAPAPTSGLAQSTTLEPLPLPLCLPAAFAPLLARPTWALAAYFGRRVRIHSLLHFSIMPPSPSLPPSSSSSSSSSPFFFPGLFLATTPAADTPTDSHVLPLRPLPPNANSPHPPSLHNSCHDGYLCRRWGGSVGAFSGGSSLRNGLVRQGVYEL